MNGSGKLLEEEAVRSSLLSFLVRDQISDQRVGEAESGGGGGSEEVKKAPKLPRVNSQSILSKLMHASPTCSSM